MESKQEKNTVVLRTRNLSIGYPLRKHKIICLQKDLNLELHHGNLICIIGKNGCGKTTLIRTISGVQKALAGEIMLETGELSEVPSAERSKLLNVVLTEKTVVDTMLVSEIVALGRYAHTNWLGTLHKTDTEIIAHALNQVGLATFSDRMYGTLSDGEKQRTFIAKALASQAPILILDEPTAHLDIPNRVEVISLLHKLTRKNNQSILVSTHNLDLALQLADEIWLLDPEKGLNKGTPEEIIDSGIINELFGGKSFEFLASSGTISLHRKIIGRVGIEGSRKQYDQLARALRRIGIETTEQSTEKVFIRQCELKYHLSINMVSREYSNLPELLREVRKAFSDKPDTEKKENE